MAEQDPRDYRGGVQEEANQGIVPREEIDDPPPQDPGPQDLKDDAMGEVTDKDPKADSIDHSAGDHADATEQGGTGADVEELEEGKPISRVDQVDLAQRTDDV